MSKKITTQKTNEPSGGDCEPFSDQPDFMEVTAVFPDEGGTGQHVGEDRPNIFTSSGEGSLSPPLETLLTKELSPAKTKKLNRKHILRQNSESGSGSSASSSPYCANPTETAASEGEGGGESPGAHNHKVSALALFQYADCVDKALMVGGGICAFIAGAGFPAFSEVFGRLLQELINRPPDVESVMANLALIMVYIGLAMFAMSFFQVFCWMLSGQRQISRIRLRFFEAVLRQDVAWHDEHKPGELTSRMDCDIRIIQNGINDKLSSGIMQFGTFVFGFGFGFFRCWELTLVMFGTLPILAGVGALMSKVLTEAVEASREHYAMAGEIATEVLENVKTVQVFGREAHEVGRYCAATNPSERAGIKREFASCISVGFNYLVLFCSYATAFYFASYLIEWGRSDVGQITATFFSVQLGSFAIGRMMPAIGAFGEARVAAHNVFVIINRVPNIDIESTSGVKLGAVGLREQITLTNINFAYPTRPDYKLFKDLNLTIQKGKSVAFSGASGCGKSSLIQLIQRFYDPNSGSIAIDGVDMRELNLMSWRDQIGIVSQEPVLFSGTIADNVRVGKSDASIEDIIDACKKANIHDLVLKLPKQYDTSVGSFGSQLSGGQKQRLAIARAIIKNPAILILDEATSALDRKSEMEVQAALDGIIEAGGLTVIVIAHRLSTIRNVDTIYFVMHDEVRGSWIAESGTYDELLAHDGHFAQMARRQATPANNRSPAVSPTAPKQTRSSPDFSDLLKNTQEKEDASAPWNISDDEDKRRMAVSSPHTRVLKMLYPDLWAIIVGLVGSVLTGGLYPTTTVVFSNMLFVLGKYAHNPTELRSQSPLWAGLFVVMAVVGFIGWVLQAFFAVAGERLTKRLRVRVFGAMLRQDAAFFDMPNRDAGVMGTILSNDCEAVHQLWGPSLGLKIQMLGNVGLGLGIALAYQWKLALVTASGIPAIAIAGAARQKLLVGFNHQTTTNGTSFDTIKSETLTNIRTVTSFNMQSQQSKSYNAVSDDPTVRSVMLRNSLLTGVVYGLSQFSILGVFAMAFWYGGKLLAAGEADFLDVVIASTAVLMGALGAGEAGGTELMDAEASSRRILSILDRLPSFHQLDTPTTTTTPSQIGNGYTIDVDNINFRYPSRPDDKIIRGLSTTFNSQSFCGLMGKTGCGKSTIIQLLARFYDYQGQININGDDLKSLNVAEWRKSISIVLQEPALFSGSVMENIKYSREEATDEEVFEVARLASIHDDILLMPNGYNTDVGYKGRTLSGGQKQRVAIARGLLRKPRLLLLDEATSALDNSTESRVQQGIEAAHSANPMTIISVAHRLTTIRNANRIVLMEGGIIIEEGSHDELMAIVGGQYKDRWETYQQSVPS